MAFHIRAGPAAGLSVLAAPALAATFGLPIFTTAPGSVFIVNEFGPDLMPTPSYTLSFTGTIGSAQGAPELVGQTIDFSWFFDGGYNPGTVGSALRIAGTDILNDALANDHQFLAYPPLDREEDFDPVSGLATFFYSAPSQGFGPNRALFPEVLMEFSVSAPLPTRTGYRYCSADFSLCEFSQLAGLTEIGGLPVTVDTIFNYPEGRLDGATLTFWTVNGRDPAPVPLPAAGGVLALALVALAGVARRRRAR